MRYIIKKKEVNKKSNTNKNKVFEFRLDNQFVRDIQINPQVSLEDVQMYKKFTFFIDSTFFDDIIYSSFVV